MHSETLPIHRLYAPEKLSALEGHNRLYTPDAFERDVIARIAVFLQEQRGKLNGCAIDIGGEIISIGYGQIDKAFDSELEDALSKHDIDLAQNGWPNANPITHPGNPDLTRLKDFIRFHIHDLGGDM